MGFLRFLLAVSVVFYHLDILYNLRILHFVSLPGPIAVKAFFIISGFYMSLILNEKYIGKSKSYFLYISNRFLRIFPLYWMVLLATYLLTLLTGGLPSLLHRSSFLGTIGSNIFSLITYLLANITLFISPNIYLFDRQSSDGLLAIGTAWTLALELTFYLVAPFIVRGNVRKIVILLSMSLILKILLTHFPILYPVDRVDYLFLPNLFYFLSGAVAYIIYRYIKNTPIHSWYYGVLALVVFISCFYSFFPIVIFFYTFKQYLFYLLIFISIPLLFKLEKKLLFNRLLGDLSYPIYISHLTILYFLDYFLAPPLRNSPLVYIFAVFVVSFGLKLLIADKLEHYRQERVRKREKIKRKKTISGKRQLLYSRVSAKLSFFRDKVTRISS